MTLSTYKETILVVSLAGVLFSGYLSIVKLLTKTCALNEPCPYLLGYPACWYGFMMFLIIFVTTIFLFFAKKAETISPRINFYVSLLGVVFAMRFTLPEIGNILDGVATSYKLGIPTCAYGLIFFVIVFVCTLMFGFKQRDTI